MTKAETTLARRQKRRSNGSCFACGGTPGFCCCGANRPMEDAPSTQESAATIQSPGRVAWDAWQAKEAEIGALDQRRKTLIQESFRLHAEMVRLGKREGWHV